MDFKCSHLMIDQGRENVGEAGQGNEVCLRGTRVFVSLIPPSPTHNLLLSGGRDFACFIALLQAVTLITLMGNSHLHQKDRELLSDVASVRHTCCFQSYSLCLWKTTLINYCLFPTGLGQSFRVCHTAF